MPGLLANAHRGILYVDDINLLDTELCQILLGIVSEGWVNIEVRGMGQGSPTPASLWMMAMRSRISRTLLRNDCYGEGLQLDMFHIHTVHAPPFGMKLSLRVMATVFCDGVKR